MAVVGVHLDVNADGVGDVVVVSQDQSLRLFPSCAFPNLDDEAGGYSPNDVEVSCRGGITAVHAAGFPAGVAFHLLGDVDADYAGLHLAYHGGQAKDLGAGAAA